MSNKTKIVATIGPASDTRQVIKQLIASGMSVARLNCSHGTQEQHEKVIGIIREISEELGISIGILLDLQGPKIRTGKLAGGTPVMLENGEKLQITPRQVIGTKEMISTDYKKLPDDVSPGDRILIDDGLIELKTVSVDDDVVTCEIINGGILKENKGINLPGVPISIPSLTIKDKGDLFFGIEMGVDYFALSFVRTANDLSHIKSIIKQLSADIPVIAKIEKPEAVDNIDEILIATDGIMVARGDLGVELKPEQVPTVQKYIIDKAIRANKLVITATQMLETMSDNPRPTRAEASDVANAIYDSTDAVMLSGETASGKYPVQSVQMMNCIAHEAENSPFMRYNIQFKKDTNDLVTHAVAQSAVNILHEVDAEAIVTFSMSGKTSKLISKQRPSKPVYAFTPSLKQYNRLALAWGITPLLISPQDDTKNLIEEGERIIVEKGFVKENDLVIIVAGLAQKSGSTNLIKIHRIGRED
jgi:pyruvate kinase